MNWTPNTRNLSEIREDQVVIGFGYTLWSNYTAMQKDNEDIEIISYKINTDLLPDSQTQHDDYKTSDNQGSLDPESER